MSGPRMGNMGQMNGNRRPNISRMNYHDSRQSSSYDNRQSSSYHDHRQSSSHEIRQHDSRSNESRQHESRQPMSLQMPPQTQPAGHSQHDEVVKYIHDSWSKVDLDKGTNTVKLYKEHENSHHLKDFRPFDLETYWGQRMHQNHHQQQHHS